MDYKEITTLALKVGVRGVTEQTLKDYEKESDGVSGGVSRLYAFCNKIISCHKAGVAHDWLYDRGGTSQDRLQADRLLCYAAALSGSFIPGWLARWHNQPPGRRRLIRWLVGARNTLAFPVPFVQLLWRIFRALVMYLVVRVAGKGRWRRDKVNVAG